ncbi:TPA: hypothetical protein ACH1Q0_003394 [Enterobacter roggenkampii]
MAAPYIPILLPNKSITKGNATNKKTKHDIATMAADGLFLGKTIKLTTTPQTAAGTFKMIP